MNYAKLFTKRSDGRYMARYRDDTGKRVSIYDRDPKALYERLQAITEAKASRGSFDNICDEWKTKHFARISGKTAEAYTAPLRRIREHFGGRRADQVTSQAIQAFLGDLGKQGFSRRSVQMHRDILNMIFNNAILEGIVDFNPVAVTSTPKNLSSKKRALPDDDAIMAVKNSVEVPFALFALICLYTGMRRGEVLALTYEDIDRKRGIIAVNKAVEYVGNQPRIKGTKTEAGNREVPLLDTLAKVLPKNGKGLIICREDGEPLTKIQFRKRWTHYCESIGFDITPHQLRHGYATILYEAGIADKDAQELLGHSSIAVTRNVYTHIRQKRKEETAKILNEYFSTPKP